MKKCFNDKQCPSFKMWAELFQLKYCSGRGWSCSSGPTKLLTDNFVSETFLTVSLSECN